MEAQKASWRAACVLLDSHMRARWWLWSEAPGGCGVAKRGRRGGVQKSRGAVCPSHGGEGGQTARLDLAHALALGGAPLLLDRGRRPPAGPSRGGRARLAKRTEKIAAR